MIYNIHLLRFLSALSVLIGHLIMWGNRKYGLNMSELDQYAAYMTVGVDVFFLISGFIMIYVSGQSTSNLQDLKQRCLNFLYKRICRIYPVWWLLLLLLLPVYLWNPFLISSDPNSNLSFINSFFLIPHEAKPILAVGWTLEFEMFFYILFGLTIFLEKNLQFACLSIIFICFNIIGLIFDFNSPIGELMTSSLLLYFPIGMGLALIYEKIRYSEKSFFLSILLTIASFAYMLSIEVGQIDRLLHFGPFATSLIFLFILFEKDQKILSKPFYKWGGDISYALYLVHLIVIAVVGKISIYTGTLSIFGTPFILFAMCIVSLFTATVLYYLYEKPVLNFLRKRQS